MHLQKKIWIYQWLSTSVFLLLMCASIAAQITSAKPTNPNITAPTPQRHEPAGGQRPAGNSPSIANAPPPNSALTVYPGDVEGFVYWDVNIITHKPAGSCAGLAVNVAPAGSSPTNTIPTGNHFKYAGQVKAFLYGGKQAVYDVCIYAYDHQPVGPQLQAQLMIDRNAFSQAPAAQTPTITPITIINGQCNMLPPIVPSSLSDLTAHWGSCQNRAYDVNFALAPALHVMGSSGGSGGMLSGTNNGARDPGPQQSPSRGLLSGSKDPGPVSAPPSGMQGKLLPTKPGAPTLKNADVIGLLKGGVPESAIISQINSSNKKFDFSSASCQALTQAKVSSKILDAMGDGSVHPCYTGGVRTGTANGADDLNPQPFPPKSRRTATILSAAKQSQKITNPKSSSQDSAIIAVLQKQRQSADAEAVQMKLSLRPAVPATAPSKTMSASGNSNTLGVLFRMTASHTCRSQITASTCG